MLYAFRSKADPSKLMNVSDYFTTFGAVDGCVLCADREQVDSVIDTIEAECDLDPGHVLNKYDVVEVTLVIG